MVGQGRDADARLVAARRAHAAGDVATALDLLPAVVAIRPDDLGARLLLARCLAATAEPAVALAAAEAAVDVDRTSWEAHVLVARAARTTDPRKARRAAEIATHLAPDEPEVVAIRAALTEDATPGGRRSGRGAPAPSGPVPPGVTSGPVDATGAGVDQGPELDEMAARVLARARAAEDAAGAPPVTDGDRGDTRGPGSPTEAADHATASASASTPTPTAVPAGPAGPADRTGDITDRTARPLSRQPFVLAGMACWVFVAFRYGVQVVGGPVGIAGFLLVLAAIALYVRGRLRTDRP